ncbi:MAG: hypothetical protein QGI09_04815, partial [Dehalococcoidia bacterium]|nr:hypothetical protein [Dehalococcoidia bacterium]
RSSYEEDCDTTRAEKEEASSTIAHPMSCSEYIDMPLWYRYATNAATATPKIKTIVCIIAK